MSSRVRGPARRRWLLAAGLVLVVAGLVVALPWLLQARAVQRRIIAEANRILAPSFVEVGDIRLSWLRPTELARVVLHDAQGDPLVAAEHASFGWNLWQILVNRPQTATLEIPQGNLDIERAADGTIDLYETLRPVISEHPRIRIKILIENGRLRYRDVLFAEPVIADRAGVILDLGRESEPITWDIQLAHTQAGGEPGRLAIKGDYSRAHVDASGRHDLTLSLKGTKWPWALAHPLVQARGELTGNVDGAVRTGRMRVAGDAAFTNLVAIGDLLATDTVHLDAVRARLSLEEYNGSWSFDTLELTSSVASLTGKGSVPPRSDQGAWLEASVDLAALARQLPSSLHLRDDLRVERGAARLRADVGLNGDGHTEDWTVTGNISDLAARQGEKMLTLPAPATLVANAGHAPRANRLKVTELTVQAPNLQINGAGEVRDLAGRPTIDLKGTLDVDWEAIRALLAQKVEPNARITGRSRAWRLAGTIDGLPAFDRMGSLEGEIGVQIDSLDVFGMRLSEVPVVLRSVDGRLTVDPIDGTLNGGVLHVEPELVRGKDGSTWLHLGPESSLAGAVINDEVSHRVLSFAAPVLDGATRVEGQVSLKLADAYFPIVALSGAEVRIQGDMLFDDVRFMPGPLVDQLIGVFRAERRPLAVLRDPVAVRIAGRKVYQRGLSIPVGNLASIGLDGSVDFDQNLDLVARFALTPPRSGAPFLTPLMENARFDLPIRGTLKNPRINGEALKERWAAIGADVLGNSMEAGVNGLQRLLQGLRVPGLRGLVPRAGRSAPPAQRQPAAPEPDDGQAPTGPAPAAGEHQVRKPPDNAADRPRSLTAAERRQRREERRKERRQKKADRRAKPS